MIVEEIKLSAVQFKSNNIIDDNLMTVMNTNSTMVSDDYDDNYDDD